VAQLLAGAVCGAPPLPQRSPGLRCAQRLVPPFWSCHTLPRRLHVFSDEPEAQEAAAEAGASVSSLPKPEATADAVLHRTFGDAEQADVVLLHLSDECALERLRAVLEQADTPAVAHRLYCVLFLGTRERLLDVERAAEAGCAALPRHLAHLRPVQSHRTGLELDASRMLLCIHHLGGVVRRDCAQRASVQEVALGGARGLIPAREALAEVAYKCGRGSKYGA
jgi:hypothetical protein